MATLTIHEITDAAYGRLKARAESNGRSPEEEVRAMIEDRPDHLVEIARRIREANRDMQQKYGFMSDSVQLIREIRDEE